MIGRRNRFILAVVFLIFTQACSPKTSQVMTQPSSPKEIVDIRVVPGAEKTQLVVEGQQPMIYTTFHLTDPYRLIVDMAGVNLGKFTQKINVNQGAIHSVNPVAGEGNQVGRLEIEVDESAETNVRTEGTNLIVEVANPVAKAAEPAVNPVEPLVALNEEPKPVLPPPVEEKNLLPAKNVKAIRFDRKEDLQLVITSDGQLSPNVFLLDPRRLVIDLPNVKMALKAKSIPAKDRVVKQARIGVHSDKVRLVVDLNGPVVYSLQQSGNQLYVHLKDASKVASSPKKEVSSPPPAESASTVVAAAVVPPPIAPVPEVAPTVEAASPSDPPVVLAEKTGGEEAKAETTAAPVTMAAAKVEEKPSSKADTPKIEAAPTPAADKSDIVLENGETSEEADKSANSKVESVTPPKYVGRKISLDFQDADIANVVRLIADVSNLNVVLGEDVKGKVTLKLINVPWDQALDIILKMNNLGQIREGNIIRIATLANISRQQDEEAMAKETKVKAEDLQTRIIYVNYGKATDLVTSLRKILSSRGDISIDDRTNALIVKDIEKNLNDVVRLVKNIDTQTPQVVIEARIVQVSPTFNRSLGIQWGASTQKVSSANILGLRGGNTGPFGTPTPDFAVNLPAAPNFGGLGFTFGRLTDNPISLDLRLSAGESQGLTRVVSTPKVSVLNNQEAKIEQGESIPFATTSQAGTQTTFVDANLTLLVTPHISPDGGIIMKIKVTKNAPGETRPGASGPSILKKEATTNVLVKDGETTVIGGIYEVTKSDSISGIPYLMDIPVLGWLFKTTTKREDTSELLVFLTPKIVK